jgi:PAS domain S-box-containing protein
MISPRELSVLLPSPIRRHDPIVRYASAVGATAVACVATYLLWSVITPAASLLFFVAVLFSSWYSGLKPGIVCSLLSVIACNYLFVHPTNSFTFGADDLLRLTVFMLATVFVSALTMARVQADQATEKIQKQLALTLKSIGDAVITTDERGRVSAMNSVAQSLTGWTQQEARGRKLQEIFSIVDEESRGETEMVVTRVLRENAVIGLGNSVLLLTRDGSEVPINEIATPIRDADGTISSVVLVLRSIPDRKLVGTGPEQILKDRLALLESVDAMMYAVDVEGTCLFISNSAAEILGYRAEELVGKHLHEVAHSRAGSSLAGVWEDCPAYRVMHGETNLTHSKETLVTRDGDVVPVGFSAAPIVIGEDILGAVISITELTEQQRAQEAVAKLATIIQIVDEGIITHSVDGIITGWNRSAERIYGYSQEEVMGRNISIVHAAGRKHELSELFERVKRREQIDTFESVRTGKGGERVDVSISVAPLLDTDGAVVGISQVVRDIRELKARQAAAAFVKNAPAPAAASQISDQPTADKFAATATATSRSVRQTSPAAAARMSPDKNYSPVPMLGRAPVMQKLFSAVERIAATESSVLITGATGTGKELVARAIHERSLRARGPFVDINCSAIPETLIEAELFGHQKGTFTGAHEHRAGLFEMAAGGTLFLDEVDALPLAAQAKLLRVIQERRVRRVGGRANIDVDVRIISATNSDLSQAINDNRFRADLFYRLRVVPLHVPELYQREGDVQLLIDHFLKRHADTHGVPQRRFTPEATRALLEYPWPGNVRQLENTVEYALAMGTEEELGIECLPPELANSQTRQKVTDLKEVLGAYMNDSVSLAEIEKRYILSVLQQFGGNQVKAAAALGIDRSKLYRRLKQYGILAVKFLQQEEIDGMQLLASRNSEPTSH